jgi:hypothetical protein
VRGDFETFGCHLDGTEEGHCEGRGGGNGKIMEAKASHRHRKVKDRPRARSRREGGGGIWAEDVAKKFFSGVLEMGEKGRCPFKRMARRRGFKISEHITEKKVGDGGL